jgi:molybdenum cofactor biosynthesis protein B
VVGPTGPEHREAIRRGAAHYAELARSYIDRGFARSHPDVDAPTGAAAAARGPSVAHGGGPARPVGCAIVTVSDTRGPAADRSGATLETVLAGAGHAVVRRAWVKDEVMAVRRVVRAALARADVDAVVITGGTGIGPRDVTPEAIAPLIDRALPGFGELFRMLSYGQVGSAAWLSRAAAGVAKNRLLVMLPGSTRAVELAARKVLLPELVHVIRLLGRV